MIVVRQQELSENRLINCKHLQKKKESNETNDEFSRGRKSHGKFLSNGKSLTGLLLLTAGERRRYNPQRQMASATLNHHEKVSNLISNFMEIPRSLV